MMIEFANHRAKLRRSDKSRWHQRRMVMRFITIGGSGTDEPRRSAFVIFARFWARKSATYGRWLYTEHRPVKGTDR